MDRTYTGDLVRLLSLGSSSFLRVHIDHDFQMGFVKYLENGVERNVERAPRTKVSSRALDIVL